MVRRFHSDHFPRRQGSRPQPLRSVDFVNLNAGYDWRYAVPPVEYPLKVGLRLIGPEKLATRSFKFAQYSTSAGVSVNRDPDRWNC